MNKNRSILISFLAVLIMSTLACENTVATPVVVATAVPPVGIPIEPPPPAQTTPIALQTYNIGDVIQIGSLILTVNGVTNPPGDQFNQPSTGKKFVVVDLTIENKGTTSISVSSLLQMSLKDSTGQKYDVDLMASVASGGSTPDGEIVVGDKLRGQVGFQVPTDATGLMFVFDADIFAAGKIFVNLP